MIIRLFHNPYDHRVVDKAYLSPVLYDGSTDIVGAFRGDVDVMRPVVRLAVDETAMNDMLINYAEIPLWGKFYYITDRRMIRQGLIEYILEEDVLMSLKSQILASPAYVERYETNVYPFLQDPERPISSRVGYTTVEMDSGVTDWFNLENFAGQPTAAPFVLGLANSTAVGTSRPTSGTDWLPQVPGPLGIGSTGAIWYGLAPYEMRGAMAAITKFDATTIVQKALYRQGAEGVIAAWVYPFDVVVAGGGSTTEAKENVKMFDIPIASAVEGRKLYTNPEAQFDFGVWRYPVTSFLDLEPYRRATMYLPYVGTVNVPMQHLIDGVKVIYQVDLMTGSCQANIFTLNAGGQIVSLLLSRSGKIGVNIPITSSNAAEIARNSIMLGLQAIGSVALHNPIGVVSSVSQLLLQQETMQTNAPEPDLARRSKSAPYLMIEHNIDETPPDYGRYIGYPYQKVVQTLSSLSGFAKVKDMYWSSYPGTEREREQVMALLRQGVILP